MPATSRSGSDHDPPPGTAQLAGLPGLGPASAAMLRSAGIRSVVHLRRLGSARAFLRVQAAGQRPSLNLLWALEGALTGVPWREVARLERTRLLLELEDLKTLSKQPHD
ncbi:MAG: TfoX/Sxy family protein [Betaproteobacteria bacterium]|uniref:TfoX/Sxy family protein n=1 Tax=Silanimonas sp. TaxID=1929290 RepID=UPI0022C80BF1|nr:TfoX/Sxy family protein [Silanimonas sp.]MCZ8167108.1 TfoX/Sxy family protein [Silanimonas sp.]